ncbi:MAG: hypothetical protein ACJA13_000553 [Paraglaciecola sp.]|jgi:hypothetical protein
MAEEQVMASMLKMAILVGQQMTYDPYIELFCREIAT